MNPNWLIGLVVVFVLLVAACGVWMNAASDSIDKSIDYTTRVVCYDSGFASGARGDPQAPPYDDSRCVELYADGYEDGLDNTYDPPRE